MNGGRLVYFRRSRARSKGRGLGASCYNVAHVPLLTGSKPNCSASDKVSRWQLGAVWGSGIILVGKHGDPPLHHTETWHFSWWKAKSSTTPPHRSVALLLEESMEFLHLTNCGTSPCESMGIFHPTPEKHRRSPRGLWSGNGEERVRVCIRRRFHQLLNWKWASLWSLTAFPVRNPRNSAQCSILSQKGGHAM